MSRFLTSFWRQPQSLGEHEDGGDLIASGAAGGATQSSTGAASWITMNDPPKGHRGEPTMAVNQTTVDEVLQPLGDEGAVNLVAIFGAARGGKSFLMNQLAGKDDIFRISNDKDPCTQGVDVSRAVVPLREFSTLDGCAAPRGVSANSKVRVIFADVEGQGDRDAAYDARLASTILPLTKCVIFNWRDSLQVDRMLNLLGVMQRAAHNIDLGDDGEGTAGPKFGHLHVVFRDWNYSGTAEDVKKQLFGLDNRGLGADVAVKNELRRTIKAAFASVTVWLFPAPVEMTSELSKELSSTDLSEGFVSQLAALRSSLSAQLSEPTAFGQANPVTGHSLGSLVPALVDVLNKGEVIMPQSAYQQMLAMEAEQAKKSYLAKADTLIETGMAACNNGPPVPPADLEADMGVEIQALLTGFEKEAKTIGAKDDAIAEGLQEIRAAFERGMQGLRTHNAAALGRHLKAAVKEARATFTEEFTKGSRASMPLARSELSAMATAASARAKARLQAVPSAGQGDESLQEAMSALGDFIELAVSKAERENDALVQEQGKKEEEALSKAMDSFQLELRTDLEAVKAKGGPYQFSSVNAAVTAALASASAALRRALMAGGGDGAGTTGNGPLSDRVPALVRRLEDSAKSSLVEERLDFDRKCAAFMMKLGTEERRRLRGETETDVYPLLPFDSNEELESAFKPVVQRMNERIESYAKAWSLPRQEQGQHMDSAKSDAESVWQSLYERNERLKLEQKNAEAGANAQRQKEEARQLRQRLEQERRKVVEAEGSARNATEAAAQARLAATQANQRARQAVGAREREAAAREKERKEEEAKRAEECERAAAEKARLAAETATREAELAAASAEIKEKERLAVEARAAAAAAEERAERERLAAAASAASAAAAAEAAAASEAAAIADAATATRASAAAEAAAAAQEEVEEEEDVEGFEDAMSVEDHEEKRVEKVEARKTPRRGAKRGNAARDDDADEEEEEEEEQPKRKAARTSGRRKTIMTPIGKDPATLKKAREEAAREIKEREEAKAGKAARSEGEDDEEEEEDSGLSEIEKSRLRAKQWAKDQKAKKDAKKKKDAAAAGAKSAKSPPKTSSSAASGAKKRGSSARKKS